MKRRILIVDDHPIVRRGFRQLFDPEPDLIVCAEAEDALQAMQAVSLQPDLAIVDLSLKGMNGLDLTKQLHTDHPDLPVLIISMHEEQLYAERSLRAGACGYVTKYESDATLLRLVRNILDHPDATRETTTFQADEEPSDDVGEAPLAQLTDREFEVFLLLGQGLTPRHIADQLFLSVNTVEVYRQRLKDKLHLGSATELTHYAITWFSRGCAA